MSLKGTPTWRFHSKLYKFGLNVFPNISHMNYRTHLILGEAFSICIFFHFPVSGLSVFLVCNHVTTRPCCESKQHNFFSSQRGRRLKGKGKGVLGTRETRTPFPFLFKRLPRRLNCFSKNLHENRV